MYYRLSSDYEVCSFKGLPCTCRNKKTNQYQFYEKEIAEILFKCNGKSDVDFDTLPESHRFFLSKALESGIIAKSAQPDPMDGPIPVKYFSNRYRKSIHWSITGRCNYHCKHCFQSANEGVLGEPTLEQCLDMIRQFEECGIHSVELTGGEPLIRKDLWQIIDALAAADIRVDVIYSNGKLVNQELLDGLTKRGMHPSFQISFDGVGYHDWFRGVPGAEEIALQAMMLLKENGFGFSCAMCICSRNMHCISETARVLASVGCNGIKVSRASIEGQWRKHTELNIRDDDLLQLYLDYLDEYYEQQIPVPIQLEGIASMTPLNQVQGNFKPAKLLFETGFTEEQADRFPICGIMEQSFFVGPNGAVVPCMSLCGAAIESQFPNLFVTPLKEILSDSCYIKLAGAKAIDLIRANEKCVSCEFRFDCIGGRCRPAAIGDQGTDYFQASDFLCYIYKSEWRNKLKAAVEKINDSVKPALV